MKKKWIRDAIKYGIKTKTWKIMRLSAFFLFLFFSQVWAESGYSQMTKLTMKMENASVIDVLDEIENNSEFYFLFNQKLVDVERKVDVDVREKTIDKILTDLFVETDVHHQVKDRLIILTTEKIDLSLEIVSQQQNTITGTVTDKSGQPLPGVTVIIKGTTNGTVTNMDGNYNITNIPADVTLVFSFVGMRAQEVVVGGQTTINVEMEVDAIGIEEVVAIGYGTQRKITVTGAVASTDGETIIKSQTANVLNSMIGQLPGVTINNRSGEPGRDNPSIFIRGRSTTGDASPLIIIDGVERKGLDRINPNDIENVTVLKDASAAIYGARAANGVIIVTTKHGSQGSPVFEFDFNQGLSQPTRKTKMANSYTFAKVYNEIELVLS